jgi:Flp pilus assembly protein TadG
MLRRLRNQRGQSFVEFAFIMPFLVFLVLGIVQFGRALHSYLVIADAARVGARAGAVNRAGACTTAISKITSLGVLPSGATPTCSTPDGVTNPGGRLVISIPYSVTFGLPGFFGIPAVTETLNVSTTATERLE